MDRPTLITEMKLGGADLDAEEFVKFFQKFHPTKKNDQLKEKLGDLNRDDVVELWNCCSELISRETSVLERQQFDEKGSTEAASLSVTKAVVSIAMAFVDQLNPGDLIPPKLMDIVTSLYGLLPKLAAVDKNLCDGIAKLCELWWSSNRLNRADYILNVLEYLVKTSVTSGTTMVFTKRLWALREAFLLIDFQSTHRTVTCMKAMFVDFIKSANFWKCDEGKNLFAFLFHSVKGDFYKDLHKIFMDAILQFSKTRCLATGEIYFKAWKNLSDDRKVAFEQCLQDIMYLSVHTAPSTANNLRFVLIAFAKHKHIAKVDGVILKLISPIIWRSLKVANAQVRLNATNLLICFFPLRDGEIPAFENGRLLDKQQEILKTLLSDPAPHVRESAVIGVCDLCSKYWELFQSNMLKTYVEFVITEASLDSSSVDVRVAVYKGITLLLDNPMTHSLLKLWLPKLAKNIHDNSEKVRLAFLTLLSKMKGLNTINYWHVVPMEDLVCRMAIDSPAVSKAVAKLIFNSFCPLSRPPTVIVDRIITLIEMNRQASRTFYRNITACMSAQDAAEHILLLLRLLYVSTRPTEDDRHSSSGEEDSLVAGNELNRATNLDPTVLTGVIESVVILWTAMGRELFHPNLLDTRKRLVKTAGKVVSRWLKRFPDGPAHSSGLFLASLIPASAVPFLSQSMIRQLKGVQFLDIQNDTAHILSLLEPSCFWSFGQLSDLIVESLSIPTNTVEANSKAPTRSSKRSAAKKVKFSADVNANETPLTPEVATEFLSLLLSNPSCRQHILRSHRDKLNNVAKVTGTAKAFIKEYLERNHLSGFSSSNQIVKLYRLNLLVNWLFGESTTRNLSELYREEIAWFVGMVASVDPNIDESRGVAVNVAKVLLNVSESLFLVGTVDEAMFTSVCDLLTVTIPLSAQLALPVLSLLSQCSEFLLFSTTLNHQIDSIETLVATPYGLLLKQLSQSDGDLGDILESGAPIFAKILVNCCLVATTAELMSFGIRSLLIPTVECGLSSQVRFCQQKGSLDSPTGKDFDRHPLFELFVERTLIRTAPLHKLFYGQIVDCLSRTVSDLDRSCVLGVCAQMLLISRNSKKGTPEMLSAIVDILTKTYETWKGRTEEDAVLLAVGELIHTLSVPCGSG